MAQRQRRLPVLWLVLAAVLLGVGAWLMRGAEPPDRDPVEPVKLPTRMTRAEREKGEERRTWLPFIAPDAGVIAEPQRPRDPVLAVMPSEVKRGAVVAEFNAILNSELGGKLTDCLFGDGQDSFLQELRDAGMDPTSKIDRVAMIDDSVVVTGDFKNAQWKRFAPSGSDPVSKDYGRQGQIHEITRADGGTDVFATWGGQMFIAGGDEAELKQVLDRLEGSGPVGNPVVDESMAYGEVYGVVSSQPIADMVRKSDPQLASMIEQSAKSMQLHMDVGHDVGMVADVAPSNAATTDELRRSLGAALSLARMQAAAKGEKDQADILDLARVREAEAGGGFRLEAGLPNAFMSKALDECIVQRKQRAERNRSGVALDAGDED
ncbi:MAG: hypothetical protein JNM17_40930 [Archangium sp.]|nr:hypothetical protein [Archangium sp.]